MNAAIHTPTLIEQRSRKVREAIETRANWKRDHGLHVSDDILRAARLIGYANLDRGRSVGWAIQAGYAVLP